MFRSNPIIIFIVKLFLLNIFYIATTVLSLGILVGPSTSALFYMSKRLITKDTDIYTLWSDYWKQIKRKFKYAFVFSLILLAFVYIIMVNLENISILMEQFPPVLILVIHYFVLGELIILSTSFFYLHGNYQFEIFKDLLVTSFYFANRHFITSIIVAVSVTIIVWAIITFLNFSLIFILFSLITTWIALLYNPISARYELRQEEEITDDE
ncbi:MAG TPA: YesL family protein [Bacilli bacterium]|nr:YesL family protein [Bacilli bacterium]